MAKICFFVILFSSSNYVNHRVQPYKFGDYSLINECRNAKRVQLINWSIMNIFNEV